MAKHTAKKSHLGIKLGSLVKDRITGFKGIAIGRTEFGYGCVHIRVQAQRITAEGCPIPVQTFDDQRVEVLAPPTKVWPAPTRSAIKLGNVVRDTLTGATGTATGRTVDIDGRIKIIIEQSGSTEGGEPKPLLLTNAVWVEVVERRELKVGESSVATSGGPMARGPVMT